MQELDIDNVDKIMGEINEQSDQMASINDALSQPLGGAAVIDEDDLEAELEVYQNFYDSLIKSLTGHSLSYSSQNWTLSLVGVWNSRVQSMPRHSSEAHRMTIGVA